MKDKERSNVMPRVLVLLTSFNGAKYIGEQLDSIIAQTYPNIEILISDDGSTDKTLEILKNYQKKSERKITVIKNTGEHGARGNFNNVMDHAGRTFDYYAFADQDDVWKKDKIEILVNTAEAESGYDFNEAANSTDKTPLLVYCDAEVVDEDLKNPSGTFVSKNHYALERGNELKQLLVTNRIQGCSMLMNRALMQTLRFKIYEAAYMHDWWVAVVAALTGRIVFVNQPLQFYRQHSGNVLGEGKTAREKLGALGALRSQWQLDNTASLLQARELVREFPKSADISIVKHYIEIFEKSRGLARASAMERAGYRTIKKFSMARFLL